MNRLKDRVCALRQGKVLFLVGAWLALMSPTLPAQGTAATKKEPYWILLEPSSVIVSKPGYRDAGMRRTAARPSRSSTGLRSIEPYSVEDWKTLRVGWDAFRDRAGKAAEKRLAELKPKYIRGAGGKARYAEIEMTEPLLAGFLYAPSFGKLFEKELGEKVVVVIPTSTRAFVFSAANNELYALGDALHQIHEEAIYPASREIFLIEKGTIKVVGMIGEEE